MTEYMPMLQSIALIGLTAGVVGGFFRAALSRRKAEVDALAREVDSLKYHSSDVLRSKLDEVSRAQAGNEKIFKELSEILSVVCLRLPPGELVGTLEQEGKLLLREFLFFKAKQDLMANGQNNEIQDLGRCVTSLLDSFENLAGPGVSVESYLPRMRTQSEIFYAWLPDILDQGKVRQQLGLTHMRES